MNRPKYKASRSPRLSLSENISEHNWSRIPDTVSSLRGPKIFHSRTIIGILQNLDKAHNGVLLPHLKATNVIGGISYIKLFI